MIINDKGKLFGKISIIDVIVLIGIIVAGFGLYTRFSAPATEKVATQNQSIEYTLLVKEVRIGTVNALKNSDAVINSLTKEHTGNIVSVSEVPTIRSVELSDGTVQAIEIPDKYDVTVTIRLDGKANDMGFYTSTNQSLTVGSTQNIQTKFSNTSGTITSVREAN